jgi:6-phosphogluconolactonase
VRGRFAIVLSGGTTPRPIYERLASYDTDWSRWHIYFSDERCLPAGHEGRNDTMARTAWLDLVRIPPVQIHSIPAELGPEDGAAAYHRLLVGEPPFDFTLLGLGEDGHTASLFPGQPHDVARDGEAHALDVLPVHNAPKPPRDRVTLSAARLSRSEHMALIVLGAAKGNAVRRLREGAATPIDALTLEAGIDVFADRAAAAEP